MPVENSLMLGGVQALMLTKWSFTLNRYAVKHGKSLSEGYNQMEEDSEWSRRGTLIEWSDLDWAKGLLYVLNLCLNTPTVIPSHVFVPVQIENAEVVKKKCDVHMTHDSRPTDRPLLSFSGNLWYYKWKYRSQTKLKAYIDIY